MLMPKMRHFHFKTGLCLLGRTQRTGSDLSKNVFLVTVLERMKILKCCFSQLGQGPPLTHGKRCPAIFSWSLSEAMEEL